MRIGTFCAVMIAVAAIASGETRSKEQLAKELDELGRIASVMVDGDVCERIITPRAIKALINPDPRDQWADSDNYDVDHTAFRQTKKELIRLSRLLPYPADLNLWMPFAPKPGKIHVVIRNLNEMSQFWRFGAMLQDMHPAMKTVLESGKRETVSLRPGIVSVLAPVYNSLGDIVGLVEVVSQLQPDKHENVK